MTLPPVHLILITFYLRLSINLPMTFADGGCNQDPAHPPCHGAHGKCSRNSDGSEGGFIADTARVDQTWTFSYWSVNRPQIDPSAEICEHAWIRGYSKILNSAQVSGEATIDEDAVLRENSKVSGNALVTNFATISGHAHISGNAIVSEWAQVGGNVAISDNAQVFGKALLAGRVRIGEGASISHNAAIFEDASVAGFASVSGSAVLRDSAHVSGNAEILGHALIFDSAQITEKAKIKGYARVGGNAKIQGKVILGGNVVVGKDTLLDGDHELVDGNYFLETKINEDLNATPDFPLEGKAPGETLLMEAARIGNLEGVTVALAENSDLNLLRTDGKTALFLAVAGRHPEVIRKLLLTRKIDYLQEIGIALRLGRKDIALDLIEIHSNYEYPKGATIEINYPQEEVFTSLLNIFGTECFLCRDLPGSNGCRMTCDGLQTIPGPVSIAPCGHLLSCMKCFKTWNECKRNEGLDLTCPVCLNPIESGNILEFKFGVP